MGSSKNKKLVAKDIFDLGVKWNLRAEGAEIIKRECLSRNPEWLTDLVTVQRLLISVVAFIGLPIASCYFCIYLNYDMHLRSAIRGVLDETQCLVDAPVFVTEMGRPYTKCESLCGDMESVPVVDEISKEEFRRHFAYSGRPILIKRATASWTAAQHFNYEFFKELFQPLALAEDKKKYDVDEEEAADSQACQFFPYSTEFDDLTQFFNMSEPRSRLDPAEKSWYVGWSNCYPEAVAKLRRHYERPAFLPDDSESSVIDWIFMGGSSKEGGGGAPVHIDHVDRPSWQALVAGSKTWILHPPPECESVCRPEFRVKMEPGDILVVDTNIWFHGTKVEQGVLTISIGSEFD